MSARVVLRILVACVAVINLCVMAAVGRPDTVAGQAKGDDPIPLSLVLVMSERDQDFVDTYSFEKLSSRQPVDLKAVLGDDLAVTGWHRAIPSSDTAGLLGIARLKDGCTAFAERSRDSRLVSVMLLSRSMFVCAFDLTYEDARSFFILQPHQTC